MLLDLNQAIVERQVLMPMSLKELDALHVGQGHEKSGLFSGISEASLQTLLQASSLRDFAAGHVLVQQGDKPECLYMVIKGAARTFRMDAEGREATIRMLLPGDTCMEAVMFMGGDSPINVQVMEASQLLLIPGHIVKRRVLEDAAFASNLLRIVARHYKNAMHQIDAMNIKSPLQRVGYYFLTRHLEMAPDSLEFTLPFRKQTVANYLGITPETFSRTLQQIKALGIEIDGERIKMRDAYVLCHFCDSDAASLCSRHGKDGCEHCTQYQGNAAAVQSAMKNTGRT